MTWPGSYEYVEQEVFVNWMRANGVKFYAVGNGGKRNAAEAAHMKRCGIVAGVPDICIPEPANGFHSLYVELKRKDGGRLSAAQKEWLEWLNENGFKAVVCRGSDEAKEAVKEYFAGVKTLRWQ